MHSLEILREVSDQKTEIAFDFYFNKNNYMALYFLLTGMGGYAVEAYPNAGHNCNEVLLSIYKYSKNNMDKDVLGAFENVFKFATSKIYDINKFLLLTEYIYLELDNEKNGISPFNVNIKELLLFIKNGLNNGLNSNFFEGSKDVFNHEVQKSDQFLYQNYGHKIL